MQLLLIVGIAFAIAAVGFALQNNVPVTVVFALWRFDSSLAMVLLLALGLGAIIAGLVTSPAVIKGQWTASRLRRQVSDLEGDKAALGRRVGELEAQLARLSPSIQPDGAEPKPYVGLKTLIAGGNSEAPRK
jgi:lipopolysaccharide assembly protein A